MLSDAKIEKGRKRLVVEVSKRDYLKVMKRIHEGASPNGDWKGLLPLRTAVLVGDIDMVALLRSLGADPYQEPKAKVKEGEAETEVTLGKCARSLAKEMASDMANPLHHEGQAMLQVMDETEEAKRRVIALQGRLEEQVAADLRVASRSTALFFVALVVCYAFMRQTWTSIEDAREL